MININLSNNDKLSGTDIAMEYRRIWTEDTMENYGHGRDST